LPEQPAGNGEMVEYELNEGVASIRMDDGKVNAFSIEMLKELHAAFDRAESDGAVTVLSGRHGFFSAGFDLKVFNDQPERIKEMLLLGATLCERVMAFARPVVTACSGHALAAGTFLPLCADSRIGVDGVFKYGLNEVKIGLTVPLFVVELARARLTPAEFNRAVITAKTYSPTEAQAAGFLDRVVAAEDLEAAAIESAAQLAALDAGAHKATKLRARAIAIEAVRRGIEEELED
jgi:enoyl-CoA hydratase